MSIKEGSINRIAGGRPISFPTFFLKSLTISSFSSFKLWFIKNNRFRSHIEKHMKSKLTWYNYEKQKGIKHMCDECGRCFTLNITLVAHIKDKHSGKVEKCDKCDFSYRGPK